MVCLDEVVVDKNVEKLLETILTLDDGVGEKKSKPDDKLNACYAVLKNVQSRISAMLSQRNDSAPIHRLPEELLLSILWSTLPSFHDLYVGDYYYHLGTIRRVCRLWTNLIDTRPLFWSLLASGSTPEHMKLVLARSGDAPLTVDAYSTWNSVETVLEFTFPHMSRCFSLALGVTEATQDRALRALAAGSKSLKRLHISYSGPSPISSNMLFADEIPSLVDLSLHNVVDLQPLPWLTNLRYMSLQVIDVSFAVLLGVIRGLPHLVELQLNNVLCPDLAGVNLGDDGEEPEAAVCLPSLTMFVAFTSQRIVTRLLHCIKAPACCDIRLRLQHYVDDGYPLPHNNPLETVDTKAFSTFLSDKTTPSTNTLSLSSDGFNVLGQGFSLAFCLYSEARGGRLSHYLPALLALPAPLLTSITAVSVDQRLRRCMGIVRILDDICPNTSSLLLPPQWGGRHDGLTELSHPLTSTEKWPLPNLRCIAVTEPLAVYPPMNLPTYRRLLRKILNIAKARNERLKGPPPEVKPKLSGVAMISKFDYESELFKDDKKAIVLEKVLRSWVSKVNIRPRKEVPLVRGRRYYTPPMPIL